MQIFKTRPELEAAVGTDTVGWIAISKKIDASTLHAGHENLISYSKTNFDVTVVNFWETLNAMYELYKLPYLEPEIDKAWDSTGCLNWCEVQGVDYILLPDPGYIKEYFDSKGIDTTSTVIYDWVDQIWFDNNYGEYLPEPNDASKYNTTIRMKSAVVMQKDKYPLNMTYVASWKDGEPVFTFADYVNKYLPDNDAYDVRDPLKTPDGLYYSSAYFQYTQPQKDLLLQVDGVVDSVGYSDTTALTVALEALNTGVEDFTVNRIDVTIGGVAGNDNDFISIYFTMGSLNDRWPIYKKGVR